MTESGQAHRKNEHLALAESNFRRTPPTSSLNDIRIIHSSDARNKYDRSRFAYVKYGLQLAISILY